MTVDDEGLNVAGLPTDGGRDPVTGRFEKGNGAALKHGVRSRQVRARLAMVAGQRIFAEGAAGALADLELELGGGRPLTTVQRATARRFLEVEAVATFLAERMTREGGPLSSKGRTRSYLETFLKVVDRQVRLAQLLGLEAPEKDVSPSTPPTLVIERVIVEPPKRDDDEAGRNL